MSQDTSSTLESVALKGRTACDWSTVQKYMWKFTQKNPKKTARLYFVLRVNPLIPMQFTDFAQQFHSLKCWRDWALTELYLV